MECLGQHMAFHKCKFQVLAWKNKDEKMLPRDNDEMSGSITLKDNQGVESKITQLSYKKANIGLGCRLTPMGDQEPEYEHRLDQAKSCAAAMGPTTLSRFEAYIAYVTRILPKVTFPFALTRFTKKQLHRLAIIIDNVVLPKMGLNRHTPPRCHIRPARARRGGIPIYWYYPGQTWDCALCTTNTMGQGISDRT